MTERIEQSMEAEPSSREHAIAIYRATISQAAELGAGRNDPDVVRRVKRQLAIRTTSRTGWPITLTGHFLRAGLWACLALCRRWYTAAPAHIASTNPNGHAPCRKP